MASSSPVGRGWQARIVCVSAFLLLSACSVVGAGSAALAQTQDTRMVSTNAADPYAAWIAEASHRFGIPDAWIRAVMQVESRGDARAISPKGAIGLMQIMPATWTGLRQRYGFGGNPYDAHDNILAGAAYLREMHDRYGAAGFLAAYNCGPVCYDDHLATGRPLPAETRTYVATLASLIADGRPVGGGVIGLPDPDAWRRAPLFVVLASNTVAADQAPRDGQAGAASVVDFTSLNPSSSMRQADMPDSAALFVQPAGTGSAR